MTSCPLAMTTSPSAYLKPVPFVLDGVTGAGVGDVLGLRGPRLQDVDAGVDAIDARAVVVVVHGQDVRSCWPCWASSWCRGRCRHCPPTWSDGPCRSWPDRCRAAEGVFGNWSVRGEQPSGFGHAQVVSLAPAGTGAAFGWPADGRGWCPRRGRGAVAVVTLVFFLPLLRVRKKNSTPSRTTAPPIKQVPLALLGLLLSLAELGLTG